MKARHFTKEADLCSAFISILSDAWVAYPETGGFDILLSRKSDGFQIGIEAKLKLNAKVIAQAAERSLRQEGSGPDCRAVLIPDGVGEDLRDVCELLHITPIRVTHDEFLATYMQKSPYRFHPDLPSGDSWFSSRTWFELAPAARLRLPDWIPDVSAGVSAPTTLTDWKIRAIKICVILDKVGYVTRRDFSFHKIAMSTWTQRRWLKKSGIYAQWVAGNLPDFRSQHPINFEQIEAAYEEWRQKEEE